MGVKKRCSGCKIEKSLSQFYNQKKGLLGRTGECKICRRMRSKIYLEKNREKKNKQARENPRDRFEYRKKWNSENPEYYREYYKQNTEIRLQANRRFFINHPERKEFYKIYARAIQKGDLKRPSQCQMCGEQDKKIQGHHFDYTEPLKVTWLCFECHKMIHKKKTIYLREYYGI